MWIPTRSWLIDYMKSNNIKIIILNNRNPLFLGWKNYDAITANGFSNDRGFQAAYEDGSFVVLKTSTTRGGSE